MSKENEKKRQGYFVDERRGREDMSMNSVQDLTCSVEIAEHVARTILSAGQYPEFDTGSVPVAVAAKVFGKDATWVQAGIISGWLPIGRATQDKELVTSIKQIDREKRTNFYISPKLLWELTGYVWKKGDA